MESRVEWLKRQISTVESELKELRESGYNPHAHPGRARRLATLLNSHRRELAAARQIAIDYRPLGMYALLDLWSRWARSGGAAERNAEPVGYARIIGRTEND